MQSFPAQSQVSAPVPSYIGLYLNRDQTRSGQNYSPWRVVKAPGDFDYAALLRQSTTNAETLENMDDIDVSAAQASSDPVSSAAGLPSQSGASLLGDSATGSHASKQPFSSPDRSPGIQSKANERRKNRRIAQKTAHGHQPSAAARRKYAKGAPTISAALNSASLPATAGGYGSRSSPKSEKSRDAYTKEELLEELGFAPLDWDGMCAIKPCARHV